MAQVPFAIKRTNPRFTFFADAKVTLRDGTLVYGQLSELSSRGCYIDTLAPIPVHSGSGLGIFGMGVLFGEMAVEQHSAIDAWLCEFASKSISGAS
jgi:hypothetical protein